MSLDVFHPISHFDTENTQNQNEKKTHRDFGFVILERKVNLVVQDHVDQYLYPKRNIFVVEQLLIVRRYLVVEEFLNDQAIELKDFHSENKNNEFSENETHYHHLYDISFLILPFFYPFVEVIVPKEIFIEKNFLQNKSRFTRRRVAGLVLCPSPDSRS
jgi:hypothetical protein